MAHRNVLLLIADDWSRIAGCYGDSLARTPHIDRLAQHATLFEHAFCTSPSCAVSRACILTGLHSHTHGQYGHCHGIHGFRTHEWVPSLPGLLRGAGYLTACIGKKHVEPGTVYPFEAEPAVDNRSPTEMAAAVTDLLRAHRDRPFYLHMGSGYPHRMGAGFGTERVAAGIEPVPYAPEQVAVPPFLPDLPDVRRDLADYYDAVARWDQVVGAVLGALQASGRAAETLVVVMTDHAMPFPGAKASSFDSGHHCPLLIARPSAPASRSATPAAAPPVRSQALVSWVDLCPTVLDWCGLAHPRPQTLAGRSLLPILDDDAPQPGGGAWEETFYSHCFHEVTNYFPYRVMRGRRYKLVRNLAHQLETPLPSDLFRSLTWSAVRRDDVAALGARPRERFLHHHPLELFDLQQDPTESRNLVDEPALQETLAAMRDRLLAFRHETHDPWLEQSFQEGEIASYTPERLPPTG